jgi:hypothetical protein
MAKAVKPCSPIEIDLCDGRSRLTRTNTVRWAAQLIVNRKLATTRIFRRRQVAIVDRDFLAWQTYRESDYWDCVV